jgi:ribosomal protein S18 acetylase RimI-like enzyme
MGGRIYDDGVDDPQPRGVIPLAPKDTSVAGGVLSRAFLDDPLWSALMSDPQTRQAMLAQMFTGLAKTTAAANGVAETTQGLVAVALWLGPGKELGWWSMVRSGMSMPRFVMKLPAQDRRRMMAVLRQMDQRRKELMPRPHWYLEAIGVEPQHQGAGFGSALVRAGMRRADWDKTPVYLETETEGNVGYYEHLGFEVVEQTIATGLNLPLWLMIRPQPAGGA